MWFPVKDLLNCFMGETEMKLLREHVFHSIRLFLKGPGDCFCNPFRVLKKSIKTKENILKNSTFNHNQHMQKMKFTVFIRFSVKRIPQACITAAKRPVF